METLAASAGGRIRNLFVVDANLLHRAGPRFAGVAQLCAALEQARANLQRN